MSFHTHNYTTGYCSYMYINIIIQVMLLQNLIARSTRSAEQFAKFYFTKGSLADNSPNFPTTKVFLHMVDKFGLEYDTNAKKIELQ